LIDGRFAASGRPRRDLARQTLRSVSVTPNANYPRRRGSLAWPLFIALAVCTAGAAIVGTGLRWI